MNDEQKKPGALIIRCHGWWDSDLNICYSKGAVIPEERFTKRLLTAFHDKESFRDPRTGERKPVCEEYIVGAIGGKPAHPVGSLDPTPDVAASTSQRPPNLVAGPNQIDPVVVKVGPHDKTAEEKEEEKPEQHVTVKSVDAEPEPKPEPQPEPETTSEDTREPESEPETEEETEPEVEPETTPEDPQESEPEPESESETVTEPETEPESTTEDPESDEGFTCDQCGRNFATKQGLSRHRCRGKLEE